MGFKKQQKGEQMKRAIFFISAIITLCSFSSQLLACQRIKDGKNFV